MDSIFRNIVLPNYPGTIILGYNTTSGMVPPFNVYQGDSVFGLYPQVGDRSAFPNGLGYSLDYPDIANDVGDLYNLQTPVTIEINSKTWDPGARMVDLSFTVINDGPELPGSYWYNVVLTEDSILQPRAVLTGCGTANPPGPPYYDNYYLNHWITRKLVFWSQGTTLIETSWPAEHSVAKSCTFSLDSGWIPENCNVTVHVYKKADSLYKSPTMQARQEPIIGWTDIPERKTREDGIIGIYPNPAKNLANIHISIVDKGICSLNVFDLKGQKIKSLLNGNRNPGLYNVEIPTNTMSSGTYLVVLETSTGKTAQKLVIW